MKIITLSTYPIDQPRHGGQHRLANIVHELRRAGHQVESLGVLGSDQYPVTKGFLGFPSKEHLGRQISNTWLMEDWAIGRWAASEAGGYAALAQLVPNDIDGIHVEQPWLFAFAQKLRAARRRPIRLIYGSENIEHELKKQIVTEFLGAEHANHCAGLVKVSELEALQSADAVVAVSASDAAWCRQQTSAPVVLAPNGVVDRRHTLDDRKEANRLTGNRKFALYCASGHPPNVVGFFDMFGSGVGCLAPAERIVIAGGAGPSILGAPEAERAPGLKRHTVAAGVVDEGVLSALLATAHVILLPITQGGGTNLKTAEALWSGRHVVATTVAMRGFEAFANARGVAVLDDAAEFRAAVREAMALPELVLSAAERRERHSVLWDSCLKPMVQLFGSKHT